MSDAEKLIKSLKQSYSRFKRLNNKQKMFIWSSTKGIICPDAPIKLDLDSNCKDDDFWYEIEIFINHACELIKHANNPMIQQYMDLLSNWNSDNHDSQCKLMKSLEKEIRLSHQPKLIQSLVTIHRVYLYDPDKNTKYNYYENYINEFMSDNKKDQSTYKFNNYTLNLFAYQCKRFFLHKIANNEVYKMPPVSTSHSPLGEKKLDIRAIRATLAMGTIPEVQETYSKINDALEIMNLPTFYINTSEPKSDVIIYRNYQLLPRLMFIDDPIKDRPIFISNDLYDIILSPFKIIIESMYRRLKCSYSSKKISTSFYDVDIPSLVQEANSKCKERYDSTLVNSDLSSATDRIYSNFQQNLICSVIDNLDEETIKSIEGYFNLNSLKDYINVCFDLLSKSNVYIEFSNDSEETIGTLIPAYGQCQGMRGSFSLLNIIHIAVCCEAFINSGCKPDLDTFLVNGDDAVVPFFIYNAYNTLWIENGAPGIKSQEKSSTAQLDYVEFCKQYIRFQDINKPIQPLNALRFRSFIKLLHDPRIIHLMRINFNNTDYFNNFKILKNNFSNLYFSKQYLLSELQIDQTFVKLFQSLTELKIKYIMDLVNNESLQFEMRYSIDNTKSPYNIFDRELWFFDDENIDYFDLEEKVGPLAIAKKFNFSSPMLAYPNVVDMITLIQSGVFPEELNILARYNPNLVREIRAMLCGGITIVSLDRIIPRMSYQVEYKQPKNITVDISRISTSLLNVVDIIEGDPPSI